MGRRKYTLFEGAIYTARAGHRRVVSLYEHAERGTRIVYSAGGERLRECGYERFRRWASAARARRAHATRAPVLRLKGEGRA